MLAIVSAAVFGFLTYQRSQERKGSSTMKKVN
jgi:hypothetical protein